MRAGFGAIRGERAIGVISDRLLVRPEAIEALRGLAARHRDVALRQNHRAVHREDARMIDHAVVRVRDLKKSARFYEAALQPPGYRRLKEFPGFVGLGAGDKTDLWIGQDDAVTKGVHLAFASRDRKANIEAVCHDPKG
jgi:hypothetical protein